MSIHSKLTSKSEDIRKVHRLGSRGMNETRHSFPDGSSTSGTVDDVTANRTMSAMSTVCNE